MKIKDQKIRCIICGKYFRNKRGIATHVFKHSDRCLKGYIILYGFNRWTWPEETFLNLKQCKECRAPLKDVRSKEFCSFCRSNNHNVMKNPDIVKKNVETNKPLRNTKEYKKMISDRSIKMYKENPQLKEKQKKYMLNGGALKARKGIKSPSKPQMKLFSMVKEIFNDSIISYDICGTIDSKKFQFEVDIAIPKYKLVIEYDEPYWHKDKDWDEKRQKKIEVLGWKFLRYSEIPSIEKLKTDISENIEDLEVCQN